MADESGGTGRNGDRRGRVTAHEVLQMILHPDCRKRELEPWQFRGLAASGGGLAEGELERLVEFAGDDPNLTRRKRLLTLVARACRDEGNVDVHDDVLAALKRLVCASDRQGPWFQEMISRDEPDRAPPSKGPKAARLNVAWCVLAWLATKGALETETALRFAVRHLGLSDGATQASLELVGVLVGIEPARLRVKIDELERRLTSAKDETGRVGRCLEKAHRQLEAKEMEISRRKNSLDRADAKARRLATQLEQVRDESANRQADDRRLLGVLLRTLRTDKDLLLDGLHALSREEPRVHVMVDHGERVVDSIQAAIDRIVERNR